MKVMQDKIDEYRTTEETMRQALLAAQQIAENMVQEGEKKTKKMMDQAKEEIEALRKTTLDERLVEEERLRSIKQVTASYVEQVRELHQKENEYLNSLGMLAHVEGAEPAKPKAPSRSAGHEAAQPVAAPTSAPVATPEPAPVAPPAAPPEPEPQQNSSGMSNDVQMYLERAMAEALGEKKAAELSEENYGGLQNLYRSPEEATAESIEATTRFLLRDDLATATPKPVVTDDNEYEAAMAQSGARIDFNRFQQEFGHPPANPPQQ